VVKTAIAIVPFVVGLALGAWSCRLPNKDHCSNQDVPGNAWCAQRNPATPYCSPCTASYDGCVPFVPTSCATFATGPEEEATSSTSGGSSSSG
jgi:hypothetical protein